MKSNTHRRTSLMIHRICSNISGKLALTSILAIIISACSASGSGNPSGGLTRPDTSNPASRIAACKSGDQQVAGQNQCLRDDAACYEIASGAWCTGIRGNICPAGSQALPANSACPAGARCFRFSESLECVILPR